MRSATLMMGLVLLLVACGGGADPSASQAGVTEGSTTSTTAAPAETTPPPTTAAPASDDGGSIGSGTATLTLDNGEIFEFSVLCSLEPQEAAGSTILFTVVSYDKPYNLDVTQFGENDFGGLASISVYDADTYDTLWEATSLLGSEVQLTLDGNVVRGTGEFVEGDDPLAPGVEKTRGELEARC